MGDNETVSFSVIVPIYNVEKYLVNCINSVLAQSYQNFELILVDDGSQDSCGKICDQFASNNKKIVVVHKKNGGLSSARNVGLEYAKGNYIIFLDSDDYWDDINALENIYENLSETNADVLIFSAKRFYEEENRFTYILNIDVEREKVNDCDVNKAIQYMLKNNIYRAAAWNKVIRRSLIEEHDMRFKVGYLSEDMDWCGDLLLYATRFDFYNKSLYVYRQQRSGSITQNKSEKLLHDKLYMCSKGYKQAKNLHNKQKEELLASYYAYEYAVTLGVSSNVKNHELLRKMKNLQTLLDYDLCNKVKQVNIMRRILGYELTRKALCLFVHIKH